MSTAEKPDWTGAAVQVRHSALQLHGDEPHDALSEHLRLHKAVQQGERYRGRQGRQRWVGISITRSAQAVVRQ